MTREFPGDEADAVTWFEPLYAAAARGARGIPWDRSAPHPLLVQWAGETATGNMEQRAIVVGAGTGDDAAFVAGLGFQTTAFDVSPSAIATARGRYPDAPIEFVVADLFALPAAWERAFSLVIEIQTVQALPRSMRDSAIAQVSRLVASGGKLVVIAAALDTPRTDGPPWPLTREDLDGFERAGLTPVAVDRFATDGTSPFASQWLAEFRQPSAGDGNR